MEGYLHPEPPVCKHNESLLNLSDDLTHANIPFYTYNSKLTDEIQPLKIKH